MRILPMLSLLANAFATGLQPPPDLTVSQWADQYRWVSKKSPEPGQWDTSRVPYTREIMDRLSPSDPCQICVLMKAAQGAGTEIGLNFLGYYMHQQPRDMMVVLPTTDLAKRFSRRRIDSLIESTPVLRDIVAQPRSRDASNNVLLKEFGGGLDGMMLQGANSAAVLRSDPVGILKCDECDGYPRDLDGEGNPLDLLIQRTAAFADRKVFLVSTPTVEGMSNIQNWFEAGDQNEFFVPCPFCSHMQVLVFGADRVRRKEPGGLRFPKGRPDLAKYQCERCEQEFEESIKLTLLNRGEWRPAFPGRGSVEKIRSYHVNALVYPYGWPGNDWTHLAAMWERDHSKPIERKAFINLKEGLPYRDPSSAEADAAALLARCEAYGPELPAGVAVLLAQADVQKNRIEVEVWGLGKGEENWSIEYHAFPGDTSRGDSLCWAELDKLLQTTWLSETGIELGIRAAAVDAGYQTDVVRQFCHARRARSVFAVIGRDGQNRPSWPTKAAAVKPGKLPPPVILGVDGLKETVYARLAVLEPGPGYCHFRKGTTLDQLQMLTAEVRVPDYTGPIPQYVWRKKKEGMRNEWLDIRGYGYGLLRGLEYTSNFRLEREVEQFRKMAEARRAGKPAAAEGLKMTLPGVVRFDDSFLG